MYTDSLCTSARAYLTLFITIISCNRQEFLASYYFYYFALEKLSINTYITMEPQAKRQRVDPTPANNNTSSKVEGSGDLYLDTIDRHMLDFDFEKVCSVSLSHLNVYACLVCGKYYQGKVKKQKIRKKGNERFFLFMI